MSAQRVRWRQRFDERGFAGGTETIPFGILVFISGTLLLVNVWAAFDTRATLDNAARDYLRAYTAQDTRTAAEASGMRALDQSLGGRFSGRSVTPPVERFGPCRPATVVITTTLPAIRLPFIGGLGTQQLSTTQTELVQPYLGASDEVPGLGATVCDG